MNPLNPMDFDALQFTKQGFNTLDNLTSSQSVQNMSQQTLHSIQTMQTPTIQGYMPQHVTPPIFQTQQQVMQFFVIVGNERRGPFTRSEIDGLLAMGQVNYQTLAWATGMNNWSSLQACLQFVQH